MSIFKTAKPSLDARFSALCSLLATAFGFTEKQISAVADGDNAGITAALDERTSAIARATAAETSLAEANTARGAAETAAEARETERAAAAARLSTINSQLSTSLQLSAEEVSALEGGDDKIIPAAITKLAGRKAVEIAAGQGVPPVPTKPSASAVEDEIKLAYESAAAEPNPRKRAAMFAKANELLAKKPSGNN